MFTTDGTTCTWTVRRLDGQVKTFAYSEEHQQWLNTADGQVEPLEDAAAAQQARFAQAHRDISHYPCVRAPSFARGHEVVVCKHDDALDVPPGMTNADEIIRRSVFNRVDEDADGTTTLSVMCQNGAEYTFTKELAAKQWTRCEHVDTSPLGEDSELSTGDTAKIKK